MYIPYPVLFLCRYPMPVLRSTWLTKPNRSKLNALKVSDTAQKDAFALRILSKVVRSTHNQK